MQPGSPGHRAASDLLLGSPLAVEFVSGVDPSWFWRYVASFRDASIIAEGSDLPEGRSWFFQVPLRQSSRSQDGQIRSQTTWANRRLFYHHDL